MQGAGNNRGTKILLRVVAWSCAYLGWFVAQASGQPIRFQNAVYALAINPLNPSTIYAATDIGVLRSTDGGASWDATNNGLPSARVTAVALDPSNPSTVYVGTQGVFKSTDGGETWAPAANGIPSSSLGVAAIAVDPAHPSILYAGLFANSGFGLARSTNGGATWMAVASTVLPNTTFDGLALGPANSSTVYAASMNGGVFKSTDAGAHWAAASNGLPPSPRVNALALDPSNPSTLYARVRGAGLFKSKDGGASWAPANNGLSASNDLAGFASALVIDPSNSLIVYTGTYSGGVFKSIDGAASWKPMNSGLPPDSGGALAIDPTHPSIVYAGTSDGRIFKSTNGGTTWSDSQSSGPCPQSVSPSGQGFAAAGGTGTITVAAASGCAWSATSNVGWISFTGAGSGAGNGSISFQAVANSGPDRAGIISIGGKTVTVEQVSASIAGLGFIGSMPHLVAEENWTTTFTLVNKSTASALARFSMFGEGGTSLQLPLNFPQQPSAGTLIAASLDRTLSANASLIIQSAGPQTPPVLAGSARLESTGPLDGFAIFHNVVTQQEAVVPLETRNAGSYLLAFDNTNGVVMGVAISNVSTQAANIPVVIRDDNGNPLGAQGAAISLAGNGHKAFVLSDPVLGFPVTANRRGTIEFDTPMGGRISVLGLRFTPPNNALTTIPALANVGTNGGSIAHLASGNGWKTTFVLVNTGSGAAQANLKFYGDDGKPLILPLSFPQTGSSTTDSSVDRPLPAGATLVIESFATISDLVTTIGSAQLSTSGNVSGFVIFRYNPTGQEAVVPLESRTASGYVLAFDNTAGTATGVAINSVSGQAADISVKVRNDTGAQISADTIPLAPNGHFADTLAQFSLTLGRVLFPETANIRGTIEFSTPPGAQIGALGIRIPPAHTFTTLPAIEK